MDKGGSGGGGFLPDSRAVVAGIAYTGAPAAPDPASAYNGDQLVIIKTDKTRFPNGDAWKCITCGMPTANGAAVSDISYPQPFPDGRRVLIGSQIVACDFALEDSRCTPAVTHTYPVVWSGGSIRELRVAPDGIHLSWNHLILGPLSATSDPTRATDLDEFAYYGRLAFNAEVKEYDLTKVNLLYGKDPAYNGFFVNVDPNDPAKLLYRQVGAIGELRGFNGDGTKFLGLATADSDNIDIFGTSLATGDSSQRLTANPAYTDPIAVSRDNKWTVAYENRYQDRMMYIAGLPGVPPITDVLPTTGAAAANYNAGNRRLFQPYLLDAYGERGAYQGQQINACPNPANINTPGSICDPTWGGQADPRWSPDGTMVAYGQNLEQAPDCGQAQVLGCPTSTEPGGRTWRFMLARFTSRQPLHPRQVSPGPDVVPWAMPWHEGDAMPTRGHIPGGHYTMLGKASGSAAVDVIEKPDKSGLEQVSATYTNYSDDGLNFLSGSESVTSGGGNAGTTTFIENLTLTGQHSGSKTTTPGGYTTTVLLAAAGDAKYVYAGSMTTCLDGKCYSPTPPLT